METEMLRFHGDGLEGKHRTNKSKCHIAMKLKMTTRDLPLQHGALPRGAARRQNRAKRTLAQFQEEATDYSATEGQVTLHLSTHYYASFGEQLKLVGNIPELGDWDVDVAPSLQWTSDHYWETNVDLPSGADVQFKVVLLSHSGVVWEPGMDRQLKAEAQPGKSALAIRVAWGIPEVQVANPVEAPAAPTAAADEGDSLAEQFDNLWDPTRAGLPADITADLETPAAEAPLAREQRQKHVTLEPEWVIFDEEEKATETVDTEPVAEKGNVIDFAPAAVEAAARDADKESTIPEEVEAIREQPVLAVEDKLAVENAATEEPVAVEQLVKKQQPKPLAEESPKLSGLQAAGKAAGYAAAGVAAAVVLSALAVDVTDAAIASAVLATGATFLPSSLDSEGRKSSRKGKGAASPVLGALEIGLKAQALVKGISGVGSKKGREQKPTSPEAAVAETPALEEIQEKWGLLPSEKEQLNAYIQAKAEEAGIFAAAFAPTEEELFETAPSNWNKVPQTPGVFANNVIPADGINFPKSANSKKQKELADKQ